MFGIFLVTRTVDASVEKKRNRKRPRNHEESVKSSNNICVESTASISESSNTAVSISESSNTAVSISGSSNTAASISGSNDTPSSASGSSTPVSSSECGGSFPEGGSSGKRIAVSFKTKIRRSAKRRKMGCPVIYDPNYFTSFSLKKENFVRYSTILIYAILHSYNVLQHIIIINITAIAIVVRID